MTNSHIYDIFQDMEKIFYIVVQFAVIMFALSVHESAHAWMADRFGDPTARYQGRISLNPIVHIDLFGSIIFPLLLALIGAPVFGWAKPVQVNPNNLRNPRKDHMWISAAGPVSNIITGIIGVIIFMLIKKSGLILEFSGKAVEMILMVFLFLIIINIYLAIFNFIPIPPLDGSWILEGMLSGRTLYQYRKVKPYGFIILLLIIYTGILGYIANPIISFVLNILRG